MPTPSSHAEPEAVNLTSTCPDEQTTHAHEDRSQPSPLYGDTNESAADISATHQTVADDGNSSAGSLQNDQSQYTTDGPQSPYTQSSPALSPSVLLEDDDNDAADKQVESEAGMRHSSATYGSSSGSRDARAPVGDVGGRRANMRRPVVRSGPRSDSRHVARYSISETDTWQPNDAGRMPISQLSSRTSTQINTPAYATAADGAGGYDVEDDYMYPEDSPSYMPCDPTSLRVATSYPSKFLRPGSRFVGTQQSERQIYDVQVEIKHVDLRESFLCGYLRIQGLTEDHPTLTTYFEGEIIGSKYGFNTKHKTWGANDRIDMSHWAKFGAFQPYARAAKKGSVYTIKDPLQKENIFMRWKEHFLVPNHRVRTIHGASFEGFYYICFNQVAGVVHGIYFHSKSEKFQQLELNHVEDKGCQSSVEFR